MPANRFGTYGVRIGSAPAVQGVSDDSILEFSGTPGFTAQADYHFTAGSSSDYSLVQGDYTGIDIAEKTPPGSTTPTATDQWGWRGIPLKVGTFGCSVNWRNTPTSTYPGGDFDWIIGTKDLGGGVFCPLIELGDLDPTMILGRPESLAIDTELGTAPFTWEVAAGALPTGLSLSAGGVLSGTPTAIGTFTFILRATDVNTCPGVREYTIEVVEPDPVVVLPTDPNLPPGAKDVFYEQEFDATGGIGPPYVFTITDGDIPPGLIFGSIGLLVGFPKVPGLYVFTVRATDGGANFGEREYTLPIAGIRIDIGDEPAGDEIAAADLELTLNRQAQAHIEIGDDYIPTRGVEIVFYARDGVTPLFDGVLLTRRIIGMTESNPANRGTVECVDFSIYFDDAEVTLVYTSPQYLEDVIADIVDQSLAIYGITYTPTSLGIMVPPLEWTAITVTDAFKRITDATGVVFRERPIKRLDVFVPLDTPAPVSITDANINAFDLEWSDGPNLPANTVDLLCGPAGEGVATKRWEVYNDTEWEVDIQAVLGNAEPARASHGFLGTTGNFAAAETVTLGSSVYTFRAVLVGDVAGDVLIGANEDDSLANLIAAIVGAGGSGYAPSTPVNTDATAFLRNPSQLAANALVAGAAGNSIPVATTGVNALWYGEGAIPISALQLGNDATGVAGWTQGYVLEDPDGAPVARTISNAPDVSGYYVWDVTDGKGTISLGAGTVAPNGTVLELKYLAVFPFHARVPAVVGPPPITFREAHPEIVDYDKGIELATKILERESLSDRELEIFTDVDGFLPGQELEVNTTHRGGIVATFLIATVRIHMVNAELWEYRITAQQSAEYKGSFVEQWKALTSGGGSGAAAAPGTLTGGGAIGAGDVYRDGRNAFTADQSLGGNQLTDVGDPIDAQDAATKAYVDAATPTGVILADGSVPMAAPLDMDGNAIENVDDPSSPQDAATKAYVDAADALFTKKDGSVAFTGDQSMGTHKLTSVVDPTAAQDAATKAYVDARTDGLVLLFSGAGNNSATHIDALTRNVSGQSGDLFQADFDNYMIRFVGFVPATNGVGFGIRVSTDGATFVSAANNYSWSHRAYGPGGTGETNNNGTGTEIRTVGFVNVRNTSTSSLNAMIECFSPLSTALWKIFGGTSHFYDTTPGLVWDGFSGAYIQTTAIRGLQVITTAGNIVSGAMLIYGIKK